MRLDTKLDTLISRQKNIEMRIENLEKNFNNVDNNDNSNQDYVKVRKDI
jgi:hypothetical protein